MVNQTAGFFKMWYLKEKVNDEIYFYHVKKHRNFLQVDITTLDCISRQARSTQNKKFTCLCYISRKTWCMKWFFCVQLNMKVFYKMILSFWVWVTSLAQITTCNKLVSLQYLCKISRKTGRMKFIFCFQISIKDFFKLKQSI